jgi:hypothetical protein
MDQLTTPSLIFVQCTHPRHFINFNLAVRFFSFGVSGPKRICNVILLHFSRMRAKKAARRIACIQPD